MQRRRENFGWHRWVLRRVHPWWVCKVASLVSLALAALTVGRATALYAGLSAVGCLSGSNTVVGSLRNGVDEI